MELRQEFIEEWMEGELTVSDLCRAYAISRKTGHKFIARFRRHGLEGLADLSRRPHHHPAMVCQEVVEAILAVRRQHPKEGVVTLLARLRKKRPHLALPAPSTAHEILRRHGLVCERPARRRATPTHPGTLTQPQAPNHVLSIDFKGQFRLGNGRLCYPLTVSDNYSRYLLRCVALGDGQTGHEHVRPIVEACFREYGLPDIIRSDNGPPFATTGLGGLSRLSVWWMRLGIRPERIEPGKPQQNGRHERMHATLKRTACQPAQHDLRTQQIVFDRFRHDYNFERPHQALDLRTPSQLYTPSPRQMPPRLPEIEYPQHMLVRKVKASGQIKLDGHDIRIGDALVEQHLGLRFEDDDRHASVFFGHCLIGTIDLHQPKRRFTHDPTFSGGGSPPPETGPQDPLTPTNM